MNDERFFALFKKYDGFKKNEIKMKRPNQLMEVLELARQILAEHIVSSFFFFALLHSLFFFSFFNFEVLIMVVIILALIKMRGTKIYPKRG